MLSTDYPLVITSNYEACPRLWVVSYHFYFRGGQIDMTQGYNKIIL